MFVQICIRHVQSTYNPRRGEKKKEEESERERERGRELEEKGMEKRRKETNDKYVFIESVNRAAESRRDEHSPRILLDTKGAAYKRVACLHSDVARPRLDDGMASANVGESKVTREKKRRGGRSVKDEPPPPPSRSTRHV